MYQFSLSTQFSEKNHLYFRLPPPPFTPTESLSFSLSSPVVNQLFQTGRLCCLLKGRKTSLNSRDRTMSRVAVQRDVFSDFDPGAKTKTVNCLIYYASHPQNCRRRHHHHHHHHHFLCLFNLLLQSSLKSSLSSSSSSSSSSSAAAAAAAAAFLCLSNLLRQSSLKSSSSSSSSFLCLFNLLRQSS